MRVVAINVEDITNSQKVRTSLEVNVDSGVERVSKSLYDTGMSNSSLAIKADGAEIEVVNDVKFDVIIEISHTLMIFTGRAELDGATLDISAVTTSGVLPEDTVFKVSNSTSISLTGSTVNKKEILNPHTGESTIRSIDIASHTVGASMYKIHGTTARDIDNISSHGIGGNVSVDDTVLSSANKVLTLGVGEALNGKNSVESAIEVSSALAPAVTETGVFYNKLNSIRDFDSELAIADNSFTYGELERLSNNTLPPVTSGKKDLFSEDVTKELAMVGSRIIKALQLFTQISMVIDTHTGKSIINGKVIYAPGLDITRHVSARIDPTVLVKTAIEELAVLTYGANTGGGYLLVAITKLIGEPSIIINITSEMASAEYVLRDDSSHYTTLIGDSDTLSDVAQLTTDVFDNIADITTRTIVA